jgi:16S rRNA (guanine966-N2)-methyltransferase
MENRRPPASKPYSPKKYYDRSRDNAPQHSSYSRGENPDSRGPAPGRDSGDRFQNREGGDRFRGPGGRPGFSNRDGGGSYRKPGGGGGGGKFFPRGSRPPLKGGFPAKGRPKPWQQENKIKIVSDLQITDGKHRGKYLQSTSSPNAHPTPRRIREIMFKILFRRIRAGRVLDLCAGCGTIGMEAISRGSMISTFVERSARLCSLIRKNLENIGIKSGHGEINEIEVIPFLKRAAKRRRFWDVVYFSCPKSAGVDEIMECFSRGTAITPGGTLVIEHDAEATYPEKLGVLKRWRVVVQDDTALTFYNRNTVREQG